MCSDNTVYAIYSREYCAHYTIAKYSNIVFIKLSHRPVM
jgi:hypothetical protein